MADTKRTLEELQAALANNVAGAISPQDLRDFLVSTIRTRGAFSRLVAAATIIGTPGTYVQVNGTTIAGTLTDMTSPVDGRLTYVGIPDRHFFVTAMVSFTAVGSNKVIGFKIAKNGVVLDKSVVRTAVTTGSDLRAVALQVDLDLVTGDYVELWVTNETTTTDVTIVECHVHADGMMS